MCRKNAFPNAHSVKKCKILSVKQGHPSETIKKRVYLQHFHPIPNLWVNHQQHLIHFVQLSVYAVSAFVEIFDVQFEDIADGIIKHEETGCFLNLVCRFRHIYQVKNRRQYFIHSLNILNLWIELGIDV